jgi:hypothetical protein
MPEVPDWQIAIVNGAPEVVINGAALRALVRESPYGEEVARRILIARGVPAALLDEPEDER